MMDRNPFSDEPITKQNLDDLDDRLCQFWEDTMIVTEPSGVEIEQAGNLLAVVRLAQKGLHGA